MTVFLRSAIASVALCSMLSGTAYAASSSSSSASSVTGIVATLTDGRNTVRPGDSLIYIVTLYQNTQASQRVNVVLALYPQANIISPDQGGTVSNKEVRWSGVTLLQGQQQQLTVQVSLDPNMSDTDLVARVSAGDAQATDTTLVRLNGQTGSQFTVAITDHKTVTAPNSTSTYTATVTNTASYAQTTDVRITPSQFLAINSTDPASDTDGSALVWRNQTFSAGQVRTYTVTTTVNRNAPDFVYVSMTVKVGTATATDATNVQSAARRSSSSSSARSSRSSSSSSRRSAPRNVILSQTVDSAEVLPGGRIAYTVYLQNVLSEAIQDAVVTVSFDSSLMNLIDASANATTGNGYIRWNIDRLNAGGVWQQTYVLSAARTATPGTQLSTLATVSGRDSNGNPIPVRMSSVQTSVIGQLPATGVPYDVAILAAIIAASGVSTVIQRKR